MAINKIDLSIVADVLEANENVEFQLISYADDSSLSLSVGRSERMNNDIYLIETADTVILDSASDGIAYVYLTDPGSGVATSYLSNTAPTLNVNKGGYYNSNDKALFKVTKSGTTYSNKKRISVTNVYSNLFETDTLIGNTEAITTELEINATDYKIGGTLSSVSLAGYYASPWQDTAQGTFVWKIGKMVHFQLTCYYNGTSAPTTIMNGIPTEWRPKEVVTMPLMAIAGHGVFAGYVYLDTTGIVSYFAKATIGTNYDYPTMVATGMYEVT